MQTENYKKALRETLENMQSIYGILLDSMLNIAMQDELKEWNEATPIGTEVRFDFEFLNTLDDMNIGLLMKLKNQLDETYQSIESLNGIDFEEESIADKTEHNLRNPNIEEKAPDREEQKEYVYKRLPFYLSLDDYDRIAFAFEIIWGSHTGEIVGDGDFRRMTNNWLRSSGHENVIPLELVDKTVDLILDYMESIGQWNSDFGAN